MKTMAETIKDTLSVGHKEMAQAAAVETKQVKFGELGIEYTFSDGSVLFITKSGIMEVKDVA